MATAKVRSPALAVVARRAVFGIPLERDGAARLTRLGHGRQFGRGEPSDWALISGLALGAIAVLEAIVYTGGVDDSGDSLAVALNLLMTAPLAARQRHLPIVAVTVIVSTLYLLASQLPPTVAGYAGVAWTLYLVAGRAPRAVSALLGIVFLLCGIAPIGGGLESAILLVDRRVRARPRRLAAADGRARRGAGRAGGDGRARPDRSRAARRGRPPHLDDRRARPTPPGWPRRACLKPASGTCCSIRSTARDAMNEMRRVLGVLRDDAGAEAEHAPAAGARPARRAARQRARRGRRGAADRARPTSRRCPRASIWPRTGSSRRHSPTPAGTRRARPSRSSSATARTCCGCACATTARGRRARRRRARPGRACASAPPRSAAGCGRTGARRAASGRGGAAASDASASSSPTISRSSATGFERAAGDAGGHHGRRQRRRRRGGDPASAASSARTSC